MAKDPEPSDSAAEIASRLKACAIFRSAPLDALEALAERSRLLAFAPEEAIIRQGEPGRCAYLILSGEASVEAEGPFGPQIVARVGAGELVGEIGAFSDTVRTASVRAVGEVRLLEIGQEPMREVVAGRPEIAMSVVAELGRRLQRGNGAMASLTHAAKALAQDDFDPSMLERLRGQADRFSLFADAFIDMAGEIAEKQRRLKEMASAAVIQRSFLPRPGLKLDPRVEIAASMTPATEVGGDFYDYYSLAPGRIAVAVGDVSGKGAPAAIFMSVCRTVLKTVARELGAIGGALPEEIVAHANEILAEDNDEGMFVTLFFGVIDLEAKRLGYCAAGHGGNLLLPEGGAPKPLAPTGPAVGLFAGRRYEGGSIPFAPGDALLVHTDGVEEAFSPDREAFGEARLAAALANAPRDPKKLIAAIAKAVRRFAAGAPQSDDLTLLALRLRSPE